MLKSMSVRATLVALAWAASFSAHALADAARQVAIPAGDLRQGLLQLSKQYGVELVYQPELVKSYRTSGVRGNYTAPDAVRLLLKGTPLELRTDPSGAMLIARPRANANSVAAQETPPADAAKEGKSKSSRDFRVAQVDQAPAGPQVSADRNPEREKHEESIEEITVTGTHIRGVSPASPIIVIDKAEIDRAGYQSTGDLVRSLPESYGGGMNATVVNAGGNVTNQDQYSGASSVNLRGFGSESTLTLVNGHRLANSDNVSAVDVSIIPLAAIDHVDVLTDGASAIYGSDAVAGVVNFVLKKHFDGAEARASYGDSTDGGGASQLYSILAGHDWGSGDVTISYEHAQQLPIFAGARDFVDPSLSLDTLLPRTRRDSGFVSIDQAVGSDLSLFAQGLYTKRSSFQQFEQPVAGLLGSIDSDVRQLGTSAGGTLVLANDWHASLTGNFAKNNADDPEPVSLVSGAPLFTILQKFSTRLSEIQVSADGPLVALPAGPLELAMGASHRTETFTQFQEIVRPGSSPFVDISAQRHVESAYAELNVPLVAASSARTGVHSLALVLAGRYDKYSDAGASSVPKLGIVYGATANLQFKASWNKSFRAPTLFEEDQAQEVNLAYDLDPFSPTGNSFKLYRNGGNPDLRPETATSTTLGVSFTPEWLSGSRFEATYYHIRYVDRIEIPIQGSVAYGNPANAPFITRNPTPEQIEDALAGATFTNNSGFPFDPAEVAAIVDGRYVNAARQVAEGVDVLANYQQHAVFGDYGFSLNATYLDLNQQISVAGPVEGLSGTVFNPPRVRARGGANWRFAGWSAAAYTNFVSSFTNTSVVPTESVSSWVTEDLQVACDFTHLTWAKHAQVLLSVQNLFNRKPPFISPASFYPPGTEYDSTNASAVGRFVAITGVIGW